jgi:hypothetical protein
MSQVRGQSSSTDVASDLRQRKEPKEDFRGGDCPKSTERTASPTSLVLENGVFLTKRWIAAREKACALRHKRRLSTDLCQEAAE